MVNRSCGGSRGAVLPSAEAFCEATGGINCEISTLGMALSDLDIALRLVEDLYADSLLDSDTSPLEKQSST